MIRNLFYSLAGALSALLLFALFIVAARALGDGPFGLFSYALSFVFLFEYLTDFGVSDIATREVARERGRARLYLANLLGYRTLLGVVVYGVIVVAVTVVSDDPRAERLVWILGISIVLRTFLNSARCVFRAFERFDLDALALTVDRLILFVVAAFVVWRTRSPEALAWTFVGVRVLSVAVTAVLVRRVVPVPPPALDWRFVATMQTHALAIGGFQVIVGAMTYLDAIMLEFWRPYEEIGWYSAAYRMYLGAAIMAPLIVGAFTPRLAQLAMQHPRTAHREVTERLFRLYWPLACAVTLFGVAGAPLWVELAYGAEYAPAAPAFQILTLGLMLVFVSVLFTQLMISIDRQGRTFPVVAAGLGLKVAANLFAIPRWGYIGAALASVVAEVLILGLFLTASRRDYRWSPRPVDVLRPLPGMVAAALLVQVLERPVLVELAAAAVVFGVGLLAAGIPDETERRWASDRLRSRRSRMASRTVGGKS